MEGIKSSTFRNLQDSKPTRVIIKIFMKSNEFGFI